MPLTLTSPAFENGGVIPKKFTAEGDDVSPRLEWREVPAKTNSFALVMEDRGAANAPFVHWVLYDIPRETKKLEENIPHGLKLANGQRQGLNDAHKYGYSGPNPRRGTTHQFHFILYALAAKPEVKDGISKAGLLKAIKGTILASAELVGRFQWSGVRETSTTSAMRADFTAGDSIPLDLEARLRDLENDKEYVDQKDRLEKSFVRAYGSDHHTVETFFKHYSFFSALTLTRVDEFIRGVDDKTVRRTLEDCVRFCSRFRVQLRPEFVQEDLKEKTISRLVCIPWPSWGQKFHVRYVPAKFHLKYVRATDEEEYIGEHLEPAAHDLLPADPDDAYVEMFKDEALKVSDTMQDLIDEGKITYVLIEDAAPYSILKDLERFAYLHEGVAVLEHNAEQRYFWCIFGEDTKKELLPKIGKVLSEFQRKYFYRAYGGRRPKMDQRKRELAVDRKPISNKAKAAELAEDDSKKMKAKEVHLSRLHKKMRDT
jgi:Raf kinase inhibitor-like YbhB/YbcL family protein